MNLLEKIFEAGVVGAGGAGFPTHKKLVKGTELLIINAAECEPLLCSDRFVMRTFPDEIIDALLSVKEEMEIKRVVVGTKQKYSAEIASLKSAIEKRGADISIHGVSGFYPAGDEQSLIYEITGETVPPLGIPIALGIVVLNVTTVLNIYDAMKGRPVAEKFVTVTGSVRNPTILRVPVGTAVSECVEAAGGTDCDDFIVIMGGPMMGKQFDKSQIGEMFIGKTDGGIVILPKNHPLPEFSAKQLEHIVNQAKSVCIQCSYCTEMCPRYLIGHPIRPNKVMRSIATGTNPKELTDALLCCECGICELYACPMGLSPRKINVYIKDLLRQNGIKPGGFEINRGRDEIRGYRRIPQSRLINRLNLREYPTRIENVSEYSPETVAIALRHGIGKPSVPVVSAGDKVEAGMIIASVDFADVGSNIHASVSGTVAEVTDKRIVIRAEEADAKQ